MKHITFMCSTSGAEVTPAAVAEKDAHWRIYGTEKEMLKAFVKTVDHYDIDILASYGLVSVDLPLLFDRIRENEVENWWRIGRLKRNGLPKQMRLNGLKKTEAEITQEAVLDIIRFYTREAGVRGLERAISKILRKIVRQQCEREDEMAAKAAQAGTEESKSAKVRVRKVRVTPKNLHDYLGVRKFTYGVAPTEARVGQVNGLAWTSVGGDTLAVEAVCFPGRGNVVRTGSLGDVMKESVQAALSVVRARATKLGIDPEIFAKTDWHIHFPEGAVPKDGPSAGAAITYAAR